LSVESNCINLELAKELHKLNVPQNSLFYWEYLDENTYGIKFVPYCVTPRNSHPFKHYSAFTSDELIQLLPALIITSEEYAPFNNFWLQIAKRNTNHIQYIANYYCDTYTAEEMVSIHPLNFRTLLKNNIHDEKFVNMLAKLLIGLTNNGYIKNEP
jgi:hypothetical protein